MVGGPPCRHEKSDSEHHPHTDARDQPRPREEAATEEREHEGAGEKDGAGEEEGRSGHGPGRE